MAREKLTGVAAARAAADNLVRRLERELREARAGIASLRSQLECGSRGDGAEAEALRREAIARPALLERVRGRRETQGQRLRRNVAWHAERCPAADAPPRDWRRAERGPRLPGGPQPGAKSGARSLEPQPGASLEAREASGGPAAREAVGCIVEICLAEAAVVILRVEGEACAAEPAVSRAVGAPERRTPLRSAARPYIPSGLQPSSDEIAEAVLEGLGVGPLAPLDRAEPGPPRAGGWKAGAEPGPPL